MSKSKRYALAPESIEAYRIRVLFHCEELQRETNPSIRATISLYSADAATTLACLETEEVRRWRRLTLPESTCFAKHTVILAFRCLGLNNINFFRLGRGKKNTISGALGYPTMRERKREAS